MAQMASALFVLLSGGILVRGLEPEICESDSPGDPARAHALLQADRKQGRGASPDVDTHTPRSGLSLLASSRLRAVHHPDPLVLDDLKRLGVDTAGMVPMGLRTPTGEEVQIFGYTAADDQYVSQSIKANHGWESDGVASLCGLWSAAGAVGNFLDVGANIGAFTLPLSRCVGARGGKVVAIEGMPSIAEHLKAGVLTNSLANVAIYPYAVSSAGSADTLTMALNPTNKGGSTAVGNKQWSAKQGLQVEVGLTTLDDIFEREPGLAKLRAMKMDIEGSEGLALGGARKLLAQAPPCTLMIELSPEWLQRADTPMAAVVQTLAEAGYDMSGVSPTAASIATYTVHQKDLQRCLERLA